MRGKIIENVTLLTKMMLNNIVKPGYVCIDATTGNGNDTLLLADLVGKDGYVYGFDIQEQAIEMTAEKLSNYRNIKLICDGHERMTDYIEEAVDFVVFNFGYLPKADKRITTKKETSLRAIDAALNLLKCHGILWLVIYPGHDAGREEATAIEDYVQGLNQKDYSVMKSAFINQRNNPPYIIAIEKKFES